MLRVVLVAKVFLLYIVVSLELLVIGVEVVTDSSVFSTFFNFFSLACFVVSSKLVVVMSIVVEVLYLELVNYSRGERS